jgi:hypothetical protein
MKPHGRASDQWGSDGLDRREIQPMCFPHPRDPRKTLWILISVASFQIVYTKLLMTRYIKSTS